MTIHLSKETMQISKILFIAYFYPPVSGTGLPGAQRVVKFVRYMKNRETYVLTVSPDAYPDYMAKDNAIKLPVKNEQILRTAVCDIFAVLLKIRSFFKKNPANDLTANNSPIRKIPATSKHGSSRYKKIKDVVSTFATYPDFAAPWLFPGFFQGLKIIRKNNIDVIFATGMPWTSLIIGYFLKIFTGKKLVIDFRDPWIDNPYINKETWIENIDRKVESRILKKSDLVIANTDTLREAFISRYPLMSSKIIVLPNGYDAYDFHNLPKIQLPDEKLIISHAGFLYLKRDPIALLKALEVARSIDPEAAQKIQFHQIGNVQLDYEIDRFCADRGITENLKLVGQMPHKNCLGYLNASDLLLLIQPDTKTQIPSKLYEYIYLNKPVLAITKKHGALAKVIETYQFGKVFGADDYREIAKYLLKMLDRKACKAGHDYMDNKNKKRFDVKNITTTLEQHIENL